MHAPRHTTHISSLLTMLATLILLNMLMGCFLLADDEPDPNACDEKTFQTTCNEDGTVTACIFKGCGFGPCTSHTIKTLECADCTLVEGDVNYDAGEVDYECAMPSVDMDSADMTPDASFEQDM